MLASVPHRHPAPHANHRRAGGAKIGLVGALSNVTALEPGATRARLPQPLGLSSHYRTVLQRLRWKKTLRNRLRDKVLRRYDPEGRTLVHRKGPVTGGKPEVGGGMAETPIKAKTTIKEVADLAGVSPSSVSRSLRGVGGISASTTERIREAAEQLGYSVSPAAYRLATGRTGTVAVVMPYLTRWFYAEVLGGAEQVVREAGLDMILYHVGDTEMRQRYFSSGLLRKRVDGVLLVTLALTEPEVSALRALDVPVCMVGAEMLGFSSISIDGTDGARKAVQYLINLGHERIGIISGDPREPEHFTAPLGRHAGYRAALEVGGSADRPEPRGPRSLHRRGWRRSNGPVAQPAQPSDRNFCRV